MRGVFPLAKNADQLLIIKNESPSFFHSVAVGVAVAEELIALLVVEGGQFARDAIGESEKQLESFNAYWHQNDTTKTKKRINTADGKRQQ